MPYSPAHQRILLECYQALEKVDRDSNNEEPSDDSDGDPDEHARLDLEYKIGLSRTEANERLINARRENVEDLRVDAVGCCLHIETCLLTCIGKVPKAGKAAHPELDSRPTQRTAKS
jgi:hypothetical protein